jgi:hypothetical protein
MPRRRIWMLRTRVAEGDAASELFAKVCPDGADPNSSLVV